MVTNIYILIDPITNHVRYVGKANRISERYKAHLNKSRKHQIHKRNWIQSLRKKGLKPIVDVVDVVPIETWTFWETYWISQMKTWGFDLINYTNGGDGCTFGNQTSFKKGEKRNLGRKHTEETRKLLSDIQKGKKLSENTKRKMSEARKGVLPPFMRKMTPEERKEHAKKGGFKKGHTPWSATQKGVALKSAQKVHQYDLKSGEFIQTWNSISVAANALNIHNEGIRLTCVGKNKSAGGFLWSRDLREKIEVPIYSKYTKNSIKNKLL